MAAVNNAAYDTIIFLGHNGPVGLGDRAEDPCGRDWEPLGGDFGDLDLANAIDQTKNLGKSVPLVTFGHMHHHLRYRKDRLRTSISTSDDGTVFLNSASVPRIIHKGSHTQRNFSLVTLQAGVVTQASLVWVDKDHSVISEEILYQLSPNQAQTACSQL